MINLPRLGFCIQRAFKPSFTFFSSYKMSKTALLIVTEGSEEMEAVISADVLRRAGVHVTIASLERSDAVRCSRDVVLLPDVNLEEVLKENYDAVILPGGLVGAQSFSQCDHVKCILQTQEKSGGLIAAICAAPIALKCHGIATGKRLTSHPCKQEELSTGEYTYVEDRVVVDGNLITSRGPGTAFEFALSIVKYFFGAEKAASLTGPMLIEGKIV